LDELHIDNDFIRASYADFQKNIDATITHDSTTGTCITCGLSSLDVSLQNKIPADYIHLKKTLVDNFDTITLSPVMVAKFAPALIITQNDIPRVDISKIPDKDAFIESYLKYIIPTLADTDKDFIASDKVDKDTFTLAVIGGLLGDKYFIE